MKKIVRDICKAELLMFATPNRSVRGLLKNGRQVYIENYI